MALLPLAIIWEKSLRGEEEEKKNAVEEDRNELPTTNGRRRKEMVNRELDHTSQEHKAPNTN
jgi:hypothetical protein